MAHLLRSGLNVQFSGLDMLTPDIAVMPGVIGKLSGSEIGRLMLPIWQGNVGANVGIFQGFDVLDGAILRVTCHVARLEFPAKAGPEDEI